jgi:hypothetical protein
MVVDNSCHFIIVYCAFTMLKNIAPAKISGSIKKPRMSLNLLKQIRRNSNGANLLIKSFSYMEGFGLPGAASMQ